ncbi:hypothetical protein CFBP3846_P500034 (plasmid) [Pseudomonas syringae pv. avii]|uniref:Uncharacterized protein n=1 Tax=Pseudomonas syringae pv. avii TaxID=663959 RepID=A0ABY1UGZ6_PSESX|nr:hypothetical protein CFBP3846_P500034 [Pseudomonas syringae pv. avii]
MLHQIVYAEAMTNQDGHMSTSAWSFLSDISASCESFFGTHKP